MDVRSDAQQIAKRIRVLIARQDAGDVTAAARRLDLPIDEVCHLERRLDDTDSPDALDLLATVARRYDTDVCWLLTGANADQLSHLPPEVRLRMARILTEIGDRILADYQLRAKRTRVS